MFHRTVIPKLNVTLPPDEVALADTIVALWTSFASSGQPQAPGVSWPVWQSAVRSGLVLQENLMLESSLQLCAMWDAIGYSH